MKYLKLFEEFVQDEVLNEPDLKTYASAIQKAQGRGNKQRKNIEKLALELIKRGEAEQVKDKGKTVNKIELPDGTVEYRNDKGQLHREGGPAVEGANGHKSWWLSGKRHRADGPAIEWANGSKHWWRNGQLHREDGPAVEWADDDGNNEYWIKGKQLTEEEFKRKQKLK